MDLGNQQGFVQMAEYDFQGWVMKRIIASVLVLGAITLGKPAARPWSHSSSLLKGLYSKELKSHLQLGLTCLSCE